MAFRSSSEVPEWRRSSAGTQQKRPFTPPESISHYSPRSCPDLGRGRTNQTINRPTQSCSSSPDYHQKADYHDALEKHVKKPNFTGVIDVHEDFSLKDSIPSADLQHAFERIRARKQVFAKQQQATVAKIHDWWHETTSRNKSQYVDKRLHLTVWYYSSQETIDAPPENGGNCISHLHILEQEDFEYKDGSYCYCLQCDDRRRELGLEQSRRKSTSPSPKSYLPHTQQTDRNPSRVLGQWRDRPQPALKSNTNGRAELPSQLRATRSCPPDFMQRNWRQ
ncbi:MAG: hypothetical protein Q9227_000061 [Pyrenula ochraceoflavens]